MGRRANDIAGGYGMGGRKLCSGQGWEHATNKELAEYFRFYSRRLVVFSFGGTKLDNLELHYPPALELDPTVALSLRLRKMPQIIVWIVAKRQLYNEPWVTVLLLARRGAGDCAREGAGR